MKAMFTRADENRLGIRFEPETFEEQLLLEIITHPMPFCHYYGATSPEQIEADVAAKAQVQ